MILEWTCPYYSVNAPKLTVIISGITEHGIDAMADTEDVEYPSSHSSSSLSAGE